MNRRRWLTNNITPEQRGIEIGPYNNPLVPKRRGYNSVVIDVFDANQLRARAAADQWVANETIEKIEEVDLIGSCTNIAELVAEKYSLASFDYIISSHNLEHMPDPIRFLQACQKVLRPGGVISLAVPDRRVCFDYFRPHSTLADWLEAYFAKRERPTASQVFRQFALRSSYRENGQELGSFSLDYDPAQIHPVESLEEAFESYKTLEENPSENYHDVHCWAFTPSSLELMLRELNFLDLIRLEIQQVTATHGCEFFLRLRNADKPSSLSRQAFYKQRLSLLHRINDEAAVNSQRSYKEKYRTKRARLLRTLRHSARAILQASRAVAHKAGMH